MKSHYIGIDGCKAGWIAIGLSRSEPWVLSVFPDIGDLWDALKGARLFLIDIPIGLCGGEVKRRACDAEARRSLGAPRASSVFTPPARPALNFDNREEASRKNYFLTGRKIGVQSWGISGKIKEVDQFLRSTPEAVKKMREAHPELLFWALNGRKAMPNGKKDPAGFEERIEALRRHLVQTDDIVAAAMSEFPRSMVARDDVLDSLVLAVTGLVGRGRLSSIPQEPQFDSFGLPMEMVYCDHWSSS